MSERIYCEFEDNHTRRTQARYRITWPNGRYKPVMACAGCARRALSDSVTDRLPVFAEPLDELHDVRSWEEWGNQIDGAVVSTDRDYAVKTARELGSEPLWRTVTALTGPWQAGVST